MKAAKKTCKFIPIWQVFSSKRSYYNIKIVMKINSQIKLNFNDPNF